MTPNGPVDLPRFEVGAAYRRADIHDRFGGSRQSGISPSASHPAIFIFTGNTGEQYGYHHDGYDTQGVFSYTGEGQIGDMTFTKGNKAIRDHSAAGRSLHLFHALGKSKPCTYSGEFVMASHEIRRGRDKADHDRDVIVFHLVPVAQAQGLERVGLPAHTVPTNLTEARQLALASCTAPSGTTKQSLRTLYERSAAVRDYVLLRARGHCEACGDAAPFQTLDGRPYLEAHHTTRVSDGGIDHPRFVGAICPTCHSRIHFGVGGKELNQMLMDALVEKEDRIWV
jgi:5-methylcytosine-specific restriction protein A